MSFLVTTIFENGFQEIYLPSVNNKTHPIDIRPHISGWHDDIVLPLAVWDDVWSMSGGGRFTITENERTVENVTLKPGLLLNCQLHSSETVF